MVGHAAPGQPDVRPPGEGGDDVLSAVTPSDDDAGAIRSMRFRLQAWHPLWGVLLGLLFVIGDARLFPGDQGLTVGAKLVFLIAVAFAAVTTILAWHESRQKMRWWYLAAAVVALIAAVVSGDWFGGATEAPPARDFIVPAAEVALLVAAAATWYAGRREGGEVLLLAAVVGLGMVAYGQDAPMAWATVAAVGATFLFLAPGVGVFSRVVGLGVHALALLALVQNEPGWFTWTPFPFLTLIPAYILALYFRDAGASRRVAWWTGAVTGGLLLGLGTSTLIGNLRRDLPIRESLFLQGMGLALGVAVALLWWVQRRQTPAPAAVADA